MDFQYRVSFELRELAILLKRSMNPAKNLGDLPDITGTNKMVIGYLLENHDRVIYQKDFEKEFSIRRSTATNMLSRMEKKGLITRESVEHDARLKKIKLTKMAYDVCKQHLPPIAEIEAKLTQGLTEKEIETLIMIIQKIKKNIN